VQRKIGVNSKNDKIPVGVLGATGSVGQKFIQLLDNHPYFDVKELAASERSAGKKYTEAVNWFLPGQPPKSVREMVIKPAQPNLNCRLVFSGLDAAVAGEVETAFAQAGYLVVSNSKNHRFDVDVPLLIPEVNPDHLGLLDRQPYPGKIVTNPNCSTIGLVMAVKPLLDAFGIEKLNVVTMQALSGAGYPGLSALSVLENVIPNISGEEEKIESEPRKILGHIENMKVMPLDLPISAQCNRVAVIDGHLLSVQVKLREKAEKEDMIRVWREFKSEPQTYQLPSAPAQPIYYLEGDDYPQPRLHRGLGNGMAVSIGRLRSCPLFDYKFSILSHNTVRGAAGGAILCAELMKAKGYLKGITA
jgi:aspartate-semialdehyde dehydrogenase